MESRVAPIISQLNEIVLGKHDAVWLCVLAILARGHALVEDLPGMGKTTLAQALSTVLGLQQKRNTTKFQHGYCSIIFFFHFATVHQRPESKNHVTARHHPRHGVGISTKDCVAHGCLEQIHRPSSQ